MLPSSLITDLRDGIQIHTDAHAESIRQTLDGLQLKLCEYDAEINALEDTMANLKKGRADLAHSISVYKSYLAPIRRLPVELLGEIFSEACAFPFGNAVYETLRSSAETPPPYCLSLLSLAKYLLIFPATLQRSSSKLTTIGISAQFLQKFRDTIGETNEDNMPPYMSLKTLFSPLTSPINLSSCQSLILEIGLVEEPELALPSPTFASLERLYLSGSFITEDIVFSHLFSDTPRLREFHLHDTLIFFDFDLDWSLIHTLWLEELTGDWPDVVEILESFPLLDVLVFYGWAFRDMTTAATIPGIRVLQIWDDSEFSADLLDVLTLPDLRRLELLDDEIGDSHHITTNNIDIIVAFLAKTSLLNEFRVDMVVIQDVDLIQILGTTPNLTKVAIVEPLRHWGQFSITERLLERMMDAGSFLPKLENLELIWAEDNVIEEGNVLDVIESRRRRLQFVIMGVRGGGELDKKTLHRIQGLRELGLSVRLY